jgi:hypothetical protein
VLGRPQLGLMAFRHPEADARALWAGLRERGWFTSLTTEPMALHLMLSPVHATVAAEYLSDLSEVLEAAKAGGGAAKIEPRYA